MTLSFLPPVDDAASSGDQASRLEGHLWRIAVEVQAAGVGDLALSGEAWSADAALTGLTRRQSEIVRGLSQGQRVHAIAQRLFVSESTVRNHLSAIYRKVGVHSQSELLARLIPGGPASTG
jgi:DNA-binding NarL/FixJ family response regulator